MAAATAACRTGPNHALVRYNRLHAGFTTHPVRPLHASYEPRSISPKYHHGTVLRSDSDALCGEPECLVQSAQPVDCTQKGPETRAAKYGVRTFAVRAATLSVRSQIERFGKPVTVSRWQVKGPIVIRCNIGNMHWHVLCLGACKFSRPRPEHESTGCRGRAHVCKCEPAMPCSRPAYLRQHGSAGEILPETR